MDFLARRRGDLNGGEDRFQFLHDDAFNLQKMIFIRRAEFFRARQFGEMVELFPAFDMGFDLGDETG